MKSVLFWKQEEKRGYHKQILPYHHTPWHPPSSPNTSGARCAHRFVIYYSAISIAILLSDCVIWKGCENIFWRKLKWGGRGGKILFFFSILLLFLLLYLLSLISSAKYFLIFLYFNQANPTLSISAGGNTFYGGVDSSLTSSGKWQGAQK